MPVDDKFSLDPSALEWQEANPIDSPIFLGMTQLERYQLMYGSKPRGVELIFWLMHGHIHNVFYPEYDGEDWYVIELVVPQEVGYHILVSRSNLKSLSDARETVDLYKKICTLGFDEFFE